MFGFATRSDPRDITAEQLEAMLDAGEALLAVVRVDAGEGPVEGQVEVGGRVHEARALATELEGAGREPRASRRHDRGAGAASPTA